MEALLRRCGNNLLVALSIGQTPPSLLVARAARSRVGRGARGLFIDITRCCMHRACLGFGLRVTYHARISNVYLSIHSP